jgi:hypothetical protein
MGSFVMSEQPSHRLQEGFEQFFKLVQMEGERILKNVENTESFQAEKDTMITSLQETVKMQQDEIDRITADFQDRLERAEQENTALRSQLGAKAKSFGQLSRAVTQMMQSGSHINAVGAYAMKLIQGDSMGDKIVTMLRGRPPRPEERMPSDQDSLSDVLRRTEPLPAERAG